MQHQVRQGTCLLLRDVHGVWLAVAIGQHGCAVCIAVQLHGLKVTICSYCVPTWCWLLTHAKASGQYGAMFQAVQSCADGAGAYWLASTVFAACQAV